MAEVKELKEAIGFMCALANGIGEAAKDGEATLGDAAHLVPLLYKLPGAVDGMGKIDDEAADLSQDEIDELVKYVKDELDLPQDKVEMAVEEALVLVVQLYSLVRKLKA